MKPTLIQPYLFFSGNCEEALQFYRTAIGAKVEMILRFKESPEPPPPGIMPPNWGEKIMHASLNIGGARVMASDGCNESTGFNGFSLSLSLPDETSAQNAFSALAEGGSVAMPLGKTFWSPCFGMVTDRFGIAWMVTVGP
jgi:PhnB protein